MSGNPAAVGLPNACLQSASGAEPSALDEGSSRILAGKVSTSNFSAARREKGDNDLSKIINTTSEPIFDLNNTPLPEVAQIPETDFRLSFSIMKKCELELRKMRASDTLISQG